VAVRGRPWRGCKNKKEKGKEEKKKTSARSCAPALCAVEVVTSFALPFLVTAFSGRTGSPREKKGKKGREQRDRPGRPPGTPRTSRSNWIIDVYPWPIASAPPGEKSEGGRKKKGGGNKARIRCCARGRRPLRSPSTLCGATDQGQGNRERGKKKKKKKKGCAGGHIAGFRRRRSSSSALSLGSSTGYGTMEKGKRGRGRGT